jgi:hypothetical protein
MIKIGFDTNAFHENWLTRGEAFALIAEFIVKGKTRAYISEISICEHITHYKKQAPAIAARAKASISQLSRLLLHGSLHCPIRPASSPLSAVA